MRRLVATRCVRAGRSGRPRSDSGRSGAVPGKRGRGGITRRGKAKPKPGQKSECRVGARTDGQQNPSQRPPGGTTAPAAGNETGDGKGGTLICAKGSPSRRVPAGTGKFPTRKTYGPVARRSATDGHRRRRRGVTRERAEAEGPLADRQGLQPDEPRLGVGDVGAGIGGGCRIVFCWN